MRAFLLSIKFIFFIKIQPIFRIFLEISNKRGGGTFIRHARVVVKKSKKSPKETSPKGDIFMDTAIDSYM